MTKIVSVSFPDRLSTILGTAVVLDVYRSTGLLLDVHTNYPSYFKFFPHIAFTTTPQISLRASSLPEMHKKAQLLFEYTPTLDRPHIEMTTDLWSKRFGWSAFKGRQHLVLCTTQLANGPMYSAQQWMRTITAIQQHGEFGVVLVHLTGDERQSAEAFDPDFEVRDELQYPWLVFTSAAVVCCNSELPHIAAAFHTPVISLFTESPDYKDFRGYIPHPALHADGCPLCRSRVTDLGAPATFRSPCMSDLDSSAVARAIIEYAQTACVQGEHG